MVTESRFVFPAVAAACFAASLAAGQVRPHAHASWLVVPAGRAFGSHAAAGVRLEAVEAKVRILDRTAATTLTLHVVNPSGQEQEAVLLLPVPKDCAISAFAFDGAASEPTARLLPAEEARRQYDEIVRKARDPALLEFAGARLIRSSVFPVGALGRQRLTLTYEEVLDGDGARADYVLLRSEALEQPAPWTIEVELSSKAPLAMVYSPSHTLETRQDGAHRFQVRVAKGHEQTPGSFRLSFLEQPNGGPTASLFAYPDPKVGGGYFLLMAGVPLGAPRETVRREVTVVLDRSGSMAGEKMDQARAAALQVIEALAEGELFNVLDYSNGVERLAPMPVAKGKETTAKARAYLAELRPMGGTNIHDALLEALRQPATPGALPIVLFLTDGLPTVGQTAEKSIRELVETGNPHRRRVFTFGVGHDVNAPLLDRIGEITRATSTYVLPKEDVELEVASTFAKLSGPVLAGPELVTVDAAGQRVTDRVREQMPARLGDLFAGESLVILGQYRDAAQPLRFLLSGQDGQRGRAFGFEFDLGKATTRNAFVPRLWAARRVAELVDQVRQAGALTGQPGLASADPFARPELRELRDEILRLSAEFGVLTEYTAFLATEGTRLGDWKALSDACGANLHQKAWNTRSGIGAFNQAVNLKQWGKEQTALNPRNCFLDDKLERVESASVQQVCDRAFFKRGAQWIDGGLVPAGNFVASRTVLWGSPEHAALVERLSREGRPGILSLKGEIVLRLDGEVIVVRNP